MVGEKQDFPTAEIKETLGKLKVALALTNDPANRLTLISNYISELRGTMIEMLRRTVPKSLDDAMGELLIAMINSLEGEQPEAIIDKYRQQINNIYHSSQWQAINDITLLKDYYLLEQIRVRWKAANSIYIMEPNAWAKSNELLADILDVLDEIGKRHDLVSMPKWATYTTADINLEQFVKDKKGREKDEQ